MKKTADVKDFESRIVSAEGAHVRRMDEIAEAIVAANEERGLRTVLVSGPSSSGKTTFARLLCNILTDKGLQPVEISIDDYFVERDQTPLDEFGKPDFEALEAVDLELLNDHLHRLTAGEEVVLPSYNFVTGLREWQPSPLRLTDRSVMILEGLHALNPRLAQIIPADGKFGIFISCLSAAESPDGERISTFDVRLIRRLVRDNAGRGKSAEETLAQWADVRRGEDRYVFPYLSDADAVFDSSLAYELPALRPKAEKLLLTVAADKPEWSEAQRLLGLLSHFPPIPADSIPHDSLLREFVGE